MLGNQHLDVFLVASGAISWKSSKQSLIASSTMESEFMACNKATSHASWLRNFISKLRLLDFISKSLRILCDNSIIVFFSKNNKSSNQRLLT